MEQENATPPGAFESGSSARSNAIAEIAARVHKDQTSDLSSFNEETGEVLGKLNAEDKPAETAQEVTPEPEQAEEPVQTAKPADDGLEVIVIDGEERKVKREQIIEAGRRTLQKESAADRRLEEASETLRRAKAYEQGIMQRQPSSDAGSESEQPSSDAANGNGANRQQATPDLGTLVDQRLWMHDANKAAQRFREEFKDIADDPYAARLVAQLEDERLAKAAAEGKPLGDPWEAYKAHGEQIRGWLGKAKPKEPVQVSADKADRKRDTVTVTGSTTRVPAPTQAKPLTLSEQIEKMRLARMGKAIPIAR